MSLNIKSFQSKRYSDYLTEMEKPKRLGLNTIGSLIMEFILAIVIIDLQTLTVDLTFKKIIVFF